MKVLLDYLEILDIINHVNYVIFKIVSLEVPKAQTNHMYFLLIFY